MVVVVAIALLLISVLLLALVLVEAVALVTVLVILPVTTPATGIHKRHNLKNPRYTWRLHEDMQTIAFWISAIWNGHFRVNLRCDGNWNVPISWVVWNGGGTEPPLSNALLFQSLQRKAPSTAWTVQPCKLLPFGTRMLDRLSMHRVLCKQKFRCRQILRPRSRTECVNRCIAFMAEEPLVCWGRLITKVRDHI